jgi:acetyl esterase/lipase
VNKWAIIGVVAALIGGLLLFRANVAPPKQLDILDSFWAGGPRADRIVEGQVFDPATGLSLDIWAPADADPKAPRPVIIFYYGGGWANGERDHYGFAGRAFAEAGFVTVVPDYRKVPAVLFPKFVEDSAKALRWTHENIAKYGGDPAKIGVTGHSAGAYNAVMLSLDTKWIEREGLAKDTIKAGIGMSGPYDFYPFDSRRSIDAMMAWPNPAETQPITYIRKDAPPLLLLTGTEDSTVKPRNPIILSRELNKLGTTVGFKAYSGLGHEDVAMALSRPFRSKAPVLSDSVAFFQTHLQ